MFRKHVFTVLFSGLIFSTSIAQIGKETPLIVDAAKTDNTYVVEELIELGVSVNETDSLGNSPLSYAILNLNYDLIKTLLNHQAEINEMVLSNIEMVDNRKVNKMLKKSIPEAPTPIENEVSQETKSPEKPRTIQEASVPKKESKRERKKRLREEKKRQEEREANRDKNRELFVALYDDNTSQAQELLKEGADKNSMDSLGNTPLLLVVKGHAPLSIVQQFYDNPKQVSQSNQAGESPMSVSMAQDQLEIFSYFVSQGALREESPEQSGQAYWYAKQKNDPELLQLVIENGADLNQLYKGQTPLQESIQSNNVNLTRQLLEKGANPLQDGVDGKTPMSTALENGNIQLYNELLHHIGSNINQPNRYGYNLLDQAFQYGSTDQIRDLMAKGAKFGPAQEKNNITPLMYAIEYNKPGLIYELVDPKTINTENYFGKTALILAIQNGDIELVKHLIKNGANVNQSNYLGNSPVGYAVVNNQAVILRQLIGSGADVNTYNKYGSTPIIEAAYFNLPQMARILKDAGADLNYRANYGDNAFDVATKFGNYDVLNELSR